MVSRAYLGHTLQFREHVGRFAGVESARGDEKNVIGVDITPLGIDGRPCNDQITQH